MRGNGADEAVLCHAGHRTLKIITMICCFLFFLTMFLGGQNIVGREGRQNRDVSATQTLWRILDLFKNLQAFTMLLCCQIVCWIRVWFLMCKCMNNVLFIMKGKFLYKVLVL